MTASEVAALVARARSDADEEAERRDLQAIAEQMARGMSVRERAARDARCNAPGGIS